MVQAAAKERQLALQNDKTHEGVHTITVIVDGGWSSRSHKHSYNALGEVAIIIGNRTKKLLHLGVRVKYCSICSRAECMKVPVKNISVLKTSMCLHGQRNLILFLKDSIWQSQNMV